MVASSRPTVSSSPAFAAANDSSCSTTNRHTRRDPTARPCSRSRFPSGAHRSSSHDDGAHEHPGGRISRGDLRADRLGARRPWRRQLLALRSTGMVREPGRRSHGGGRQAWVRRPHPRDPGGQTADERVGSGRGRQGAERLRPFGAERLDGVHGRAKRRHQARPLAGDGGSRERDRASEGRAPDDSRSHTRVDTSRPQPHAPAPSDSAGARVAAHGELPEVQGRVGFRADQRRPMRSSRTRLWGWATLAAALAATCAHILYRGLGQQFAIFDFAAYYYAAVRLGLGHGLYPQLTRDLTVGELGLYLYPPPVAAAFLPFTVIPVEAASVIWAALLLGLAAVVIFALTRPVDAPLRPLAAGLLVLSIPLQTEVANGNLTLVTLALVLAAWRLQARSAVSGALLAIALVIKLMPPLPVPFLLAAGRCRVPAAPADSPRP